MTTHLQFLFSYKSGHLAIFVLIAIIVSTYSFQSCADSNFSPSKNLTIDSLELTDCHIHYEYYKNGKSETLVLIHAGMLDSDMWKPQIKALSKDQNLVLYDLPSHGRSGTRDASMNEHEYLAKLLDHLSLTSVSILGSSLGSIVATEFALEHPERVKKLILMSPGINGYQPNDFEFTRHVNDYVKHMSTNKYPEATQSLAKIAFTGPNRDIRELDEELSLFVEKKILNHINQGFWKEAPYFISPQSDTRLSEIGMSTLLIMGQEDFDYIHNTTKRLAEKISSVEVHYIEDAAHLVNMEVPKVFNEILTKFLSR